MRDWWLKTLMLASASCFLLVATGCKKVTRVNVNVDATGQLDGAASLHVTATANGMSSANDVPKAGEALSFPTRLTFELSDSASGIFTARVAALDANGAELTSAEGMVMVVPGSTLDLAIVLIGPPVDDVDMAPTDLPPVPDDMPSPPPSVALWIGAGGSAASATQRLNLTVGGSLTVGTATATSNAKFTGGFAAHQTH